MIKILFVCHGNICRSTMAEFVLKDLVKKKHLDSQFEIDSVATSREEIGSDTHYGTKNILQKYGIPYTKRHARQITKADYDYYDYIIVMDDNNLYNLNRLLGNNLTKVTKLMSYVGLPRDVLDPWYTGDFEATYQDISTSCVKLLEQVHIK